MILGMKFKRPKKKQFFLFLLALAVFLSLYVFLQAKKQTVIYFEGLNQETITFRSLVPSMTADSKAYFFCDNSDIDCRYIDTEMIDILLIDAHVQRFDNIILVDTSTLDQTILPSALLSRYGFSDFPAFAILSYENGAIVVHSVLEWKNSDPFTMLDLKEWMKDNKLWLKEYTN